MKPSVAVVVLVLLSASVCFAQDLALGTILPLALRSQINAQKAKPGDRISGKLAQDVTVEGTRLPRGTEVLGRIVQAQPGSTGSPARITITFDSVRLRGRELPVTTSLRALASAQAVYEAQLPTNLIDDYGSSIADWNTLQVGGQSVYRGDGTVTEGLEVVGKANIAGEVWGEPKTWPWLACVRDQASKTVQSFWVFSTDACGLYGFDGLKLMHAGRSEPAGQIVLESAGKLQIRAGSGWLLIVTASGEPGSTERGDSRKANLSDSIESSTQ